MEQPVFLSSELYQVIAIMAFKAAGQARMPWMDRDDFLQEGLFAVWLEMKRRLRPLDPQLAVIVARRAMLDAYRLHLWKSLHYTPWFMLAAQAPFALSDLDEKHLPSPDNVETAYALQAWFLGLPGRTRAIVGGLAAGYTAREIAGSLHLTEGRISQIRKAAVLTWEQR